MKEIHGVAQIRPQPKAKLGECRNRLINVHRLAARLSNEDVLCLTSLSNRSRERINIGNCPGENSDSTGLIGVSRPNTFQGCSNLVIAAAFLGERIMTLMPREDEMGSRRHLQLVTVDSSGGQRIDLVEQRWQIDDHTVRNDRRDGVVKHA